jgi:ABC-2 type transport system ATP-binding protein
MNIIQADHLMKSFGTVIAVNDVSLAVREGEILGFLGPNGAGKTTTTRILTGIIPRMLGLQQYSGMISRPQRYRQNRDSAWSRNLPTHTPI